MNWLTRIGLVLSFVVAVATSGCSSVRVPYGHIENWIIRQNAVPCYFAEYDVIYIWPTIERSAVRDSDASFDKKAVSFRRDLVAFMTTDALGNKARVFAPIVHEMDKDLYASLEEAKQDDWSETDAAPSVEEVVEVIRFYLETYHPEGRPYFLVGHGQGAMMIYEALKELDDEVTPEDGCVAVYLPNLPTALISRIPVDFGEDELPLNPAAGRYDTGVVIAWREEPYVATNAVAEVSVTNAVEGVALDDVAPDATNEVAAAVVETNVQRVASGFLNPLTWSARREATTNENIEARFYDALSANVLEHRKIIPNFCDATPIGTNGLLRVSAPAYPEISLSGELISLFNGNIVQNMRDRVNRYSLKRRWDGWKTETSELPYEDEKWMMESK